MGAAHVLKETFCDTCAYSSMLVTLAIAPDGWQVVRRRDGHLQVPRATGQPSAERVSERRFRQASLTRRLLCCKVLNVRLEAAVPADVSSRGAPALHVRGKRLQTDMAQSEEVRKRFSREIEILASLEHENVMPVEDSGETRTGIPWFVMPKADHPVSRRLPCSCHAGGATRHPGTGSMTAPEPTGRRRRPGCYRPGAEPAERVGRVARQTAGTLE